MASLIGQTLSHHKILERLGVGGGGEVYQVEDARLKEPDAINSYCDAHRRRGEEGNELASVHWGDDRILHGRMLGPAGTTERKADDQIDG